MRFENDRNYRKRQATMKNTALPLVSTAAFIKFHIISMELGVAF